MISFIVPAHNEQFCLSRTLKAIQESASGAGQPFEVIVVDDASTDATAKIAAEHGATVLKVNHRQIAATRNSGGRAAGGNILFFVDADTLINRRVVESALKWMKKGAAGGGALTRFEGPVPLYARLMLAWIGFFMRIAGLSGGAFMFCKRTAFEAVGGFDERLYGAEDAAMSSALKREGRFVVLNERLLTSGRRVRAMPGLQTLFFLFRVGFLPSQLTRRSSVEKVWYNSDRANDEQRSYSIADRISNGLALLILAMLVTLPVWIVPWPQALLAGPLGSVKLGARTIMAHFNLVLWPCSVFLLRASIRQTRWLERIKLGILGSLSLWFACQALHRVYLFWGMVLYNR